jgi:hypothetical protein
VAAGLSLIVIVVCWLTMPANRPHVGVVILRVEMVASLAVGVFVARRLLFGRSPVLGGEVFMVIVYGSRVRDRTLYRSWYALG